MRLLVTGSRNWSDASSVYLALSSAIGLYGMPSNVTIVHGGAQGADSIAAAFARNWQYTEEAHPADWLRFGRAAGPIRNQEMVDLGADVCVAFLEPGSKGTADCIKRASEAGIPVTIITPEDA